MVKHSRVRHWWQTFREWSGADQTRLTAWQVQDDIERAIIATGTWTKYGKTIRFGNTMMVRVSPQSFDAIKPAYRQAIQEIRENLPSKLKAQGWKIDGELRISLGSDPTLKRRQAVAEASDSDTTPDLVLPQDRPAVISPRITTQRAAHTTIRVFLVGGTGEQWTLEPGRPVLVGRRGVQGGPKIDIAINNRYVSAMHVTLEAVLRQGVPAVKVMDHNSTHGTWVERKRVSGEAHATHGQTIQLTPRRDGAQLRVFVGSGDSDTTSE